MCRSGGRNTKAKDAKHGIARQELCLAAHARASLVGVVGVVARFIAANIRRRPCGLPLSTRPRRANDAAKDDQWKQIEVGPRLIDVW